MLRDANCNFLTLAGKHTQLVGNSHDLVLAMELRKVPTALGLWGVHEIEGLITQEESPCDCSEAP